MNYDAVVITLVLLATAAGISLLVVRSEESGSGVAALALVRTVLAATGAVLVVVTVPVLSAAVPQGEYGPPVGSFLAAVAVLLLGFACEQHIRTVDRVRREEARHPVVP
jgi:hypothetical protein